MRKSEIINIKTDPVTKKKARKLADKMGFSLSSILNAYLKQFVITKTLNFAVDAEEPSEWLIKSLEKAERNEKEGWVSPVFDNVEDSVAWLRDPNSIYQNGKTDVDRV